MNDTRLKTQNGLPLTVLGMIYFVASEFVFLVGCAIAFLLSSRNYPEWPPNGIPVFPLLPGIVNMIILLLSGFTIYKAWQSVKKDAILPLQRYLLYTGFFGLAFVYLQSVQIYHLFELGLSLKSGLYVASFLVLVGMHGIHVIVGIVSVWFVWIKSRTGEYYSENMTGIQLCMVFWAFVVVVWPFLYVVIYFS